MLSSTSPGVGVGWGQGGGGGEHRALSLPSSQLRLPAPHSLQERASKHWPNSLLRPWGPSCLLSGEDSKVPAPQKHGALAGQEVDG